MKKINQKEIDAKYIRRFSSVSVKNICIDLGIEKDYTNVIRGTASAEKLHKVAKEIEKRMKWVVGRYNDES